MIQTQTPISNRTYPIRVKVPQKQTKYTMHDIAKVVSITAYIESLLDDFDRLVEMKINDKVKQSVRKLLSRHDHSASAYFNKDNCLAMSNIITKNIDDFREEKKKELSKKQLDNNHFVLMLTYELNSLRSVVNTLFDSGSIVYSNVLKGLINALNLWLSKQEFTDRLNIHKKRDLITGTIDGFIGDVLVIFESNEQ